MAKSPYDNHVSSVKDGSIIFFPHSACYWIKVCNPMTGIGGVVELYSGKYYPVSALDNVGLGIYCSIVAKNLDTLYFGEDNENG